MSGIELKRCPCCGSEAQMRETAGHDYFVKCANAWCGLRTKNCHENESGAAAIWNDRAGEGS